MQKFLIFFMLYLKTLLGFHRLPPTTHSCPVFNALTNDSPSIHGISAGKGGFIDNLSKISYLKNRPGPSLSLDNPMDEMIEFIRKFESLFLPLLPRKWQNPPPSYRIIVPLLEKIGPYRQWVLAVSVWIISMIAYGMGWRPPLIGEIGMLGAVALWGAFAVGITLLAWKQKASFLRGWIFWGLFLFFLFQQYRSDTQINYHLFKGFTFLGVPLIIYHLIMGQYLKKDLSRSLPWSSILIAGRQAPPPGTASDKGRPVLTQLSILPIASTTHATAASVTSSR